MTLGLAVLFLLGMSPAPAEEVAVADFSFESPDGGIDLVSSSADYMNNPASSWQRFSNWGIQDWKDSTFSGASGNTQELGPGMGFQSAFLHAGSAIYQNVGPILPHTTYTLTVAIGNRPDKSPSYPNTITLALYNGYDLEGTLLASKLSGPADNGTFRDFTLEHTTGASVSGDLVLALDNRINADGHTVVDNVRLSSKRVSIPEPGAFASIAGLLSLVGVALRRRHECRAPTLIKNGGLH